MSTDPAYETWLEEQIDQAPEPTLAQLRVVRDVERQLIPRTA